MFQDSALPLSPTPLDKTTKHLTRLTNYISQVIANPAYGRGDKSWILRFAQNDGVDGQSRLISSSTLSPSL
jgi:hypothetical protein